MIVSDGYTKHLELITNVCWSLAVVKGDNGKKTHARFDGHSDDESGDDNERNWRATRDLQLKQN